MGKNTQSFFAGPYEEFIYTRTYSRWNDELKRRETWPETVDRYMSFMKENLGKKLSDKDYADVRDAILNLRVMPSMRLLWASGDAARKNAASSYNCSFTAIDSIKRFREILFLLTSGCGVGFSVEKKFVDQLPSIEKQTGNMLPIFVIPDSREGWADALHAGVTAWYDGNDIDFDFSKIRPLGSRLKNFGGRASGPDPLRSLLVFARATILNAQGRKLRPIEVHDIATKIAEIVVAGGTRRSSEISLSDLHDEELREAKAGNFYEKAIHRVMANNSVAYESKPSQIEFMKEWLALAESGSGERGIFNREAAVQMMPERRRDGLTQAQQKSIGVNPCSEILLRSSQFCNLTSVVCRPEDTEKTLLEKVRIATIMGTYQSSLTDFHYLTKIWKDNSEEERLLGVSLNGQQDCLAVQDPATLRKMRERAIEVNKEYAKKIGIRESAAITAVKPEGTGSQMLSCSSGVHPRYAKYYIRRVRISSSDPLFAMLRDQGVPYHPENGQSRDTATTFVLEFPVKSPEKAKTRHDVTALDQLEYWKKVKVNYAEHTVSITVYVGKDEWIDVGKWVWDNWDIVTGISFLPKEDGDHVYQLAPYEEISKERYEELVATFPDIDFGALSKYEIDDETKGAAELACVGGVCEIT